MSEHRRRSQNPGGGEEPPGRRPGGQQPYAYGSPPEGAPSYDRPGRARAAGSRETAQQPRLTRAEMRKQTQKGGGRGAQRGATPSGPPSGRGGKPGKKRFIDYPRFGKAGVRRWLPSWKQILTIFLVFFGSGVATVGVVYAMTTVPNPKDIGEQNNIYYWADNSEMTRQGTTNRQLVELSDINKNAQNAVIAAENETFWKDSGIDPKGMARAVYKMATGGDTQGGSTITQQYVKNTYLTQEQSLSRKAKEFFITLKVNQQTPKEEILKDYLNTAWFGRGATGIQAAAQAYYGVDAKNLDACQSAMLAGLLKGANLYDPTLNKANHDRMAGPDGRWSWILGRMVITKAITPEERAKCANFPEPIPKKAPASMNGEVGYLVETANKYILSKDPTLTQAALDRGGFRIHTTFQKDKVEQLKAAVDTVSAKNLDPKARPETDTNVQVGAASVVPGDGAIVAIYGGPGFDQNHFANNADASGVPVGSTFKPFVLATAMQVGVLTQKDAEGKPTRLSTDSRYNADDYSTIRRLDGSLVMGTDGKPFKQKNDEDGKQGWVSLKKAMAKSFNVPYVQLKEDVGGKNVADMAERMGLKRESFSDPNTAAFALGTSTPSAIRMASAYSVFAARGKQADPYSVTRVEFSGRTLPAFTKPQVKPVLDQDVADNITDVLQGVVQDGTGYKAQKVGRAIAGKTGTTDGGKSAWFVGYTPQLTTSVSMFREDPAHPELLSLKGTAGKTSFYGGDFPTEIFTAYMKAALNGQPELDFPTPGKTGDQVDASGAPSTASPSASATDSATAVPSTIPSPSAGSSQSGGPSGSPSPGQSCFLGPLCPSPTPTKTRPGKPSPSPTDTSTVTPGGAAGNGASSG